MKQFIIISLSLILLLSCKTNKSILTIDQTAIASSTEKHYTILDHKIEGDTLILTLEIEGKYKPNRFQLLSNGIFLKSNPPKLHLFLLENYKEKKANEARTEILRFNISEAKYSNTEEKNSVTLILSGYSKPIKYEY